MKKAYYIDMTRSGYDFLIIDEDVLAEAERGNNYLNPDDFMFHLDAESYEEARDAYLKEVMLAECERFHP